jgi:hypothetical protein
MWAMRSTESFITAQAVSNEYDESVTPLTVVASSLEHISGGSSKFGKFTCRLDAGVAYLRVVQVLVDDRCGIILRELFPCFKNRFDL